MAVMKKELIKLIVVTFVFLSLLFVFFVQRCRSEDVYVFFATDGPCMSCDHVRAGSGLYMRSIRLGDGQNCDDTATARITDILNSIGSLGSSCSACAEFCSSSCTEFGIWVCCDAVPLADAVKREDVALTKQEITGIAVGQEPGAAESAFQTWSEGHAYPSAPSGFVRTDAMEGYTYTIEVGEGETSNINLTGWKRAGFAKEGNIYTLEEVESGGGGSSGGGITSSDLANVIDDKFGEGGSISLVPEGVYSGGNIGSSDPYNKEHDSFSSTWDAFVLDMKDTELYGLVDGFFSGVPSSGEAGTITIDGGNTFGSHDFEMSWFDSAFLILKGFVIVVCSFVAVRLLVVNK